MPSELLFSRGGGRLWAVVREDGEVVELRVERERESLAVGRIVKARVSRILPGIQAAFLDVGQDREAFLHANDLILAGWTVLRFTWKAYVEQPDALVAAVLAARAKAAA